MTAPVAPTVDATPSAPAAPVTAPEAPSFDGNVNISDMVQKAADQHETSTLIESFQGRSVDSITLDDIRALPGAQGMTDEQLQALWDEAKGTKPAAPAPETPVAPTKPRAYKIMLDGKEVADVESLSAKDLLRAKVQYQANNKSQEKTWDEVVRNAQLGHYNAERMNQVTTERNNALTQIRELSGKLVEADARDKAIAKAFDAARREDYEPLKALIEKYGEMVDAEPEATPGNNIAEQQAVYARGQQVLENYVMPVAQELASQFEGVSAEEIQQGIEVLISREPMETFNAARLEQICRVEVPQYLQEMLDARASAPKVEDPRDREIAELKAQLARQTTTTAQQQNARLDEVHARRRAAPSALPAIPSSAATMETPQINSAEDAMEFLKKFKG